MKNKDLVVELPTRYKLRTVVVNGIPTTFISRYTQATFKFLEESEVHPSVELPKSWASSPYKYNRDQLPQINANKLLKDMSDKGIFVEKFDQKPSTLLPMQNEFNVQKIHNIIRQGRVDYKPIITTRDQFILDGHHRAVAHYNMGDKPIKVNQINLNAEDVLKHLGDESIMSYKGINEQINTLLKEDEQTRIALAYIAEAVDLDKDQEESIKEAADICDLQESDLSMLIEMVTFLQEMETKKDPAKLKTMSVIHPIRTIRKIANSNIKDFVVFKNGESQEVSPKLAKFIMHMHKNMNDANKKKIETMVTRGPKAFTRISKWASYHGKGTDLNESVTGPVSGPEDAKFESCETIGCMEPGDHMGKHVKIITESHEHKGKTGMVDSSSPCGMYHSVVSHDDHLGIHHHTGLQLLKEDELAIDSSGMQKPILVNPTSLSQGAVGSYTR